MNVFGLSGLLVFVACVSMVIVLYFNAKKSFLAKIWIIYSMMAGLWGYLSFRIASTSNYDIAYSYWKWGHLSVIFTPTLFFHFVHEFLRLQKKYLLYVLYAVTFVLAILELINPHLYTGELRFVHGQFFWPAEPGVGIIVYTFLFIVGLNNYSLYKLYKAQKSCPDPKKRTQIQYYLIGAIIGWLGAYQLYFTNLYPDSYPVGNFLVMFYPIIYVYAMIKCNLMDIEFVLKKGVVYSALVALISIFYLLIVLVLGKFFEVFIGQQPFLINMIVLILIAVFINPIRGWIQHYIDNRLFHGTLESLEREKDRLQQELFHAEKLAYVGQLASSVVHEIRNPLTSIKTYLEYLPQKYDDQEFRNKINDLIPREIGRVEKMVSQLLGLAKDQPLNLVDVRLEEIIRETVQLLENHFKIKDIQVRLEIEESIYPIKGDRDQLKQVFLNLFLNAIQAMEPGGQLEITHYTVDGMVTVLVKDNGCGMSEATLEGLFTPFRTTKENGIGLGLSITKEIVEQHQGQIRVTSWEGVGTTFQLNFPY